MPNVEVIVRKESLGTSSFWQAIQDVEKKDVSIDLFVILFDFCGSMYHPLYLQIVDVARTVIVIMIHKKSDTSEHYDSGCN